MADYVEIFVYGTLQRGMPLDYFMDGAEFVREARTAPLYTLTACRIPYLWSGGETQVEGEVWRVPRGPVLKELNRLEAGYTLRDVELEDGQKVQAWFAGYTSSPNFYGRPVESGSYRQYFEEEFIRA